MLYLIDIIYNLTFPFNPIEIIANRHICCKQIKRSNLISFINHQLSLQPQYLKLRSDFI